MALTLSEYAEKYNVTLMSVRKKSQRGRLEGAFQTKLGHWFVCEEGEEIDPGLKPKPRVKLNPKSKLRKKLRKKPESISFRKMEKIDASDVFPSWENFTAAQKKIMQVCVNSIQNLEEAPSMWPAVKSIIKTFYPEIDVRATTEATFSPDEYAKTLEELKNGT